MEYIAIIFVLGNDSGDIVFKNRKMKVEQIYTGCLAQGAYYIVSNGEAAIVDPLREIQPYIDRAAQDGVKIKYIFETHFHADFVSGHVDLAKATGATIVYGPTANPTFVAHIAKDNEVFNLGNVKIKVLHTPGHTMESSCFVLINASEKEEAVFTGDTLFIGDVGRPDLAQKAANMTQEQLAEMLFDSLRNKVMKLNDDVVGIHPLDPASFELLANGTGALVIDTRDASDFAKGFIPNAINIGINGSFAPWVGALVKDINQSILLVTEVGKEEEVVIRLARVGYDHAIGFLKGGMEAWKGSGREIDTVTSISAQDFQSLYDEKVILIDVRKESEYQSEHIESALNIPLDFINDHLAEIPKDKAVYMHCAGGYRSMIANSLLKARRWNNVIDIAGGFVDLAATEIPKTAYVCPSTLK